MLTIIPASRLATVKQSRNKKMTGIIDSPCPICTEHHTFCIAEDGMVDGEAEYEFTCPTTRAVGRLQNPGWTRIEQAIPSGTVEVHRVP
jgi:hypothetical protein